MTSRQQQIGEVETCHEQHDHGHEHQEQGQPRSRAAPRTRHEHETRRRLRHYDRVAAVDRRKSLLESTANGGDRRRRSGDRGARPESPHNTQLVRLARSVCASRRISGAERLMRAERQPDFRSGDTRPRESFPRHPDDREVFAADAHEPAQHARVGAELLPERITDDRDSDAGAGPFLFDGERTAMRQRHAEDLEVVGGHSGGHRAPRPAADIQTDEARGGRRQACKDVSRTFFEIPVVRVGEGARSRGGRQTAVVDAHHLVGVCVERPQEQAVDEAEHGDVHSDAERKGGDGR